MIPFCYLNTRTSSSTTTTITAITMTFVCFLLIFSSCESEWSYLTMVEETCKRVSSHDSNINYSFCVSALGSSNPRSSQSVHTLEDLGVVSFQISIENATAVRAQIKGLLDHTAKDEDEKDKVCLSDCLELYSQAVSSLQEGLKNFQLRRFDDANIQVSSALDAPTTCEDGFKEKAAAGHKFDPSSFSDINADHNSPLTKQNADFFQLSALSLAFTTMFP